jgi:hypothetical protein
MKSTSPRRRQAAALAAGVMRASPRHCEERRDEAIHTCVCETLDCFASLAMTVEISHDEAMPSLP